MAWFGSNIALPVHPETITDSGKAKAGRELPNKGVETMAKAEKGSTMKWSRI